MDTASKGGPEIDGWDEPSGSIQDDAGCDFVHETHTRNVLLVSPPALADLFSVVDRARMLCTFEGTPRTRAQHQSLLERLA
jgi:hypothetical protein